MRGQSAIWKKTRERPFSFWKIVKVETYLLTLLSNRINQVLSRFKVRVLQSLKADLYVYGILVSDDLDSSSYGERGNHVVRNEWSAAKAKSSKMVPSVQGTMIAVR